MTIRQLRTLVAIADTKTFSAAAEATHITHSAVSQQMQALEADLGIALFHRRARTPELTATALQIVAKARALIADYDNLVPSVLEDGGLRGVLTLGVMRTTLTGLTPRAVAMLKAKYPEIVLHIRPGLTRSLVSDIERGVLDAAVTSRPDILPPGIVFRELTREPMQLIAPMGEPEEDPLQLLATRPFIRFDRGAVVGALIDTWILAQRIKVDETMELDSLEAIASMVHADLGVSIVPDLAVKPPDALPIKRLSLGNGAPERVLGLIHQEKHPKTRALDAVFEAFSTTISSKETSGAATAQAAALEE